MSEMAQRRAGALRAQARGVAVPAVEDREGVEGGDRGADRVVPAEGAAIDEDGGGDGADGLGHREEAHDGVGGGRDAGGGLGGGALPERAPRVGDEADREGDVALRDGAVEDGLGVGHGREGAMAGSRVRAGLAAMHGTRYTPEASVYIRSRRCVPR